MTPDRTAIAAELMEVVDPEIGINIVDLGLVYGIHVEEQVVVLELSMTSPTCPMSDYIARDVARALREVPAARRIRVEIVREPAWSPEMMSEEARRFLFPGYRTTRPAAPGPLARGVHFLKQMMGVE